MGRQGAANVRGLRLGAGTAPTEAGLGNAARFSPALPTNRPSVITAVVKKLNLAALLSKPVAAIELFDVLDQARAPAWGQSLRHHLDGHADPDQLEQVIGIPVG